ncbi:MAG TPA: arsenosugar biosynthesis radical SAM (seleno)protein ArsS [Methylomirabilota bacterium]|nr:arsenosugar biosynthesis radical SAM (seleno)protein ArsS [Methylomirabilota bacterium]
MTPPTRSLARVRADLELDAEHAGPKRTRSLRDRRSPLAPPAAQLAALDGLPLARGDFEAALRDAGWDGLRPAALQVFQINVGRLCNMTCRHCHVDAGPDRVNENMDRETIDLCLAALDRTTAHTVDITGGAPELNPHFRYLVDQAVARGKHVVDRCNLTVLLIPRFADLPGWLAERGVEVVCSLPHYRKLNTDAQRGDGTFDRSVEALRRLNASGYGQGDPRRRLTLISNPAGAFLPGAQASMEREWKAGLARNHGVTFDRLITLNNMPISRFLEWLLETENLQGYMEQLIRSFNPAAVAGVMCRTTLSVAWDGTLHDCDFNQMLDLPVILPAGSRPHVRDLDPGVLQARAIRTGRHCFGCTAGAGSS